MLDERVMFFYFMEPFLAHYFGFAGYRAHAGGPERCCHGDDGLLSSSSPPYVSFSLYREKPYEVGFLFFN
jgi:hypothetical protein